MTDTNDLVLQADSGVYPDKEGYERTVLFSFQNPDGTRRLLKVDMRIDRIPGDSFLIVSEWSTDDGWIEKSKPHNVTFWSEMPSYARHKSSRTEEATFSLMKREAAKV